MTENVISFFDCTPASREGLLSVMPVAVEETVITVKETAQTAYTYIEKAAHRLLRWITVTAKQFRRTLTNRVRAFVRHVVCMTGVQILRKCAILRS